MSHTAEPSLVHPTAPSVTGLSGIKPHKKRNLSNELIANSGPKKAAVFTLENLKRDALAGSITGLLAVPLTVGICLMSEYPIETGLMTVIFACLIGFITFLFKPGNYVGTPGVAAGLAPVLALSIHKFGMENMPFLIFLTATSQAIAWKFNLQRFILKAIPAYLIEGLLAGIGLKIALKFLPYTYGILHETHGHEWLSMERIEMIGLSIAALALFLHLFGKYKAKYPAIPYVAVIIVGIVAGIYLKLPMLHIEHSPFKLALPFPDFAKIPPAMLLEIVGYSLMLSLIDVIEQVTSNSAIEKLDPLGRPANTNNSLLAIWIANMGSSFFGGMTNLDGLAKSATNALAGAVTKMSNLFTALVLLVFVIDPHLLEHLPYFSLAVLMIFTGWKMIAGLVHVASHGSYALLLALFCGILTYTEGIFEGLIVVLVLHLFINFVIFRHEHIPMIDILKKLISKFSEQIDPRSTDTLLVHKDHAVGGLRYSSINRNPADKKLLTDFINDWAFGVNQHSLPAVVGCYDYQGLLWGTFAKELREGHNKIKGYFEHLFELENVHVEFKSGEVRQYKDIYIQSGKYIFTFDRKKERISVPARYSFVCKKERNGWFILEHHSSEFPA
ncbi:SulP family inorganic anion transporter [Prosthecobacter sp.]|uniref:SulP family inorganic anion transporter n=1 Tax=Prosthecobacter sp. TaxID=1965333 RepID=UPI002AB9D1AA|nr:SulP family inorganic anion transporter [Prosthecobacter sp.]MDZ4403193.1 SulP family inorganic anion transporter [Prosthecobacter sp.]